MRWIAEGLFTDEMPPRLVAGRSRATGRIVFPCPGGPDGGAGGSAATCEWERLPLPREGRLWSYTVQRFRPKSPPYAGPEAFAPWIVAYVEIPSAVIVEARLVDVAVEEVRIGMELEMVPAPLDPAVPDGVLIPAFRPARAAS